MVHSVSQLGDEKECINVKLEALLITDLKNIKTGDGKKNLCLNENNCMSYNCKSIVKNLSLLPSAAILIALNPILCVISGLNPLLFSHFVHKLIILVCLNMASANNWN